MSIGCVSSYKLGACSMINAVPKIHANANSHRNKRSNTMATYFQSSSTWKREKKKRKRGHKMKMNITISCEVSICGKLHGKKYVCRMLWILYTIYGFHLTVDLAYWWPNTLRIAECESNITSGIWFHFCGQSSTAAAAAFNFECQRYLLLVIMCKL